MYDESTGLYPKWNELGSFILATIQPYWENSKTIEISWSHRSENTNILNEQAILLRDSKYQA